MSSFLERLQKIQDEEVTRKQKEKEEEKQSKIRLRQYEQEEKQKHETEIQQFFELQKQLREVLDFTGAKIMLREIQKTLTYDYGKTEHYKGPFRSSAPSDEDIKDFLMSYRDPNKFFNKYHNAPFYGGSGRFDVSRLSEGIYLTGVQSVVVSTSSGQDGSGGSISEDRDMPIAGVWTMAERKSPQDIYICIGAHTPHYSHEGFKFDPSISQSKLRSNIENKLIEIVKR